jgi:TrmH family RNA methyltransferase
LTLLEGPHLLEEAVAGGMRVFRVFANPDDRDAAEAASRSNAELVTVTQPVLDRLAPTEHPRGPVAVVEIPEPRPLVGRNALVLWRVGDPGNVGTLLRTAAAFGLGVFLVEGTADPWSPKVLRAAAGAHFRLAMEWIPPTIEAEPLSGYSTIATVVSGGEPPAGLTVREPFAILVGDEAHGLRQDVIRRASRRVTIPMPGGVESLNAAVAGAIIAYALVTGSGD